MNVNVDVKSHVCPNLLEGKLKQEIYKCLYYTFIIDFSIVHNRCYVYRASAISLNIYYT